MSSKIYLAALAVSIAVMAFFTYYSWSWLQSIGLPAAVAAGFEYHSAIAWPVLWISAVALLLLGNAVLWTTGRSWAMWVTFVYFAAMIVIRFFWLNATFLQFQKEKGLAEGGISVGPLLAVILIALMAAIVFFDQFIVPRLRLKTLPWKTEEAPQPAETAAK